MDSYLALRFELEQAKNAAEISARIDLLTNIYNRRAFYEIAQQHLIEAQRYHRSLSIVMLDIDHFESINDSFGHAVGDAVLVKLANLLNQQSRRD
ncbi:hypothetical protein GCM10007414_33130 [Agarivorans gilvus]|uniref:diguanylate cyclase n=1 Tax=Agarivorans gilvus TaxID=680279 RepID=A0ABQ1I5G8_9ALTE|nr:hypothetical protein GCM10007414_33130 [Agarivorans gilvus]